MPTLRSVYKDNKKVLHMSSVPRSSATRPPRPKYVDINLLHLPPAGLMSIFHRVTGVVMFGLLIPTVLCVLQGTLGSEAGFMRWKGYFAEPMVKLIVIGFIWAYMHHFFAGIRYLLLDVHVGIAKEPATLSARLVMIGGVVAAILIGARIW